MSNNTAVGNWLEAFRLRTLPLALSSIGMGSALAGYKGFFQWNIFLLAIVTTIFLQILSNLANDYGDSENGADHEGRLGPLRSVQKGAISKRQMQIAMAIFSLLSFCSGIGLLSVSIGLGNVQFYTFVALGILCIAAAIKYTSGHNPYGYQGLGDISVFIFFGLVGVLGSYYLYAASLSWDLLLPAISCGAFATAVLNVNNMRDIESDKLVNKNTIPVKIGLQKAKYYHSALLLIGSFSAVVYHLLNYHSIIQFLFLISILLFAIIYRSMKHKSGAELDPFLKKTAANTLLFVILFSIGLLAKVG